MIEKPTVLYWHLWTDSEGISRQTRCAMDHFDLESMQAPADPQWQGERTHGAMTVLVTVQPVGWVGTWHENPKPQWIVPLSGRWFVESMDGTRTEMGAGELSFGGDQNCRPLEGKRGHRSGTIGDNPAVLMVIQFDDLPAPSPCEYR
ncbi:MAG TPA: cupin domain-containing protein [Stellaceae bacterium]|nr:cupin domain-containing protein [Stellaceae bacterium]